MCTRTYATYKLTTDCVVVPLFFEEDNTLIGKLFDFRFPALRKNLKALVANTNRDHLQMVECLRQMENGYEHCTKFLEDNCDSGIGPGLIQEAKYITSLGR